jgi:hypothetical protein
MCIRIARTVPRMSTGDRRRQRGTQSHDVAVQMPRCPGCGREMSLVRTFDDFYWWCDDDRMARIA